MAFPGDCGQDPVDLARGWAAEDRTEAGTRDGRERRVRPPPRSQTQGARIPYSRGHSPYTRVHLVKSVAPIFLSRWSQRQIVTREKKQGTWAPRRPSAPQP